MSTTATVAFLFVGGAILGCLIVDLASIHVALQSIAASIRELR